MKQLKKENTLKNLENQHVSYLVSMTPQSVYRLGYGLYSGGIKVRFSIEAKYFSSVHDVQTDSEAHAAGGKSVWA
jgi:hypothetical protein